MMGDDQASTMYTALEGLESSFDEGDLQVQGDGTAAAAASAAPPAEQQGGVPHRWKVVGMMALSFVLCNMDKVRGWVVAGLLRVLRAGGRCFIAAVGRQPRPTALTTPMAKTPWLGHCTSRGAAPTHACRHALGSRAHGQRAGVAT